MQHPCDLLKYIEYYRYTFETESVYIAENAERLEALDAYVRFAEEHGMKGDNLRLWMYNVALDCIRTMPQKERAHLLTAEDIGMLHFDYGMYIRSHYIYRSRLHGESWCADELSHAAIDLMLTILRATPSEP